jgi:hypothetical protein
VGTRCAAAWMERAADDHAYGLCNEPCSAPPAAARLTMHVHSHEARAGADARRVGTRCAAAWVERAADDLRVACAMNGAAPGGSANSAWVAHAQPRGTGVCLMLRFGCAAPLRVLERWSRLSRRSSARKRAKPRQARGPRRPQRRIRQPQLAMRSQPRGWTGGGSTDRAMIVLPLHSARTRPWKAFTS